MMDMDKEQMPEESIETAHILFTGIATTKRIQLHYENFNLSQNPKDFLAQLKQTIGEIEIPNVPEKDIDLISVEQGSIYVSIIIKDGSGNPIPPESFDFNAFT